MGKSAFTLCHYCAERTPRCSCPEQLSYFYFNSLKGLSMNTKIFLVVFVILSLASCAQLDPHPMDMTNAIQGAKTSADHDALAKHYEAAAEAARLKVKEHKKELREYETHPYYGRRAQDLKAHCHRLINSYEQTVEANMAMAEIHRKMAAEAR